MPHKMSSMKEVYNVLYAPDEDDTDDIADTPDIDDTDLDRLAKSLGLERLPPYKANGLYLGQIGRYEVWEGRTGYGVWSGDICHGLGFDSVHDAASAAHALYADDAAEYARYIAIRQVPAVASRKNIKKVRTTQKTC